MKSKQPLVSGFYLIRGFLCGSLVAGSLMVPYGLMVQAVLFILAAAIFLDTLFTYHRRPFVVCFVMAFFAALALGIVSGLFSLTQPLLLVVFILMAITYLHQYLTYREHMKAMSRRG